MLAARPSDLLPPQVESLSGGERRRLHLASVLIERPNLLILDGGARGRLLLLLLLLGWLHLPLPPLLLLLRGAGRPA
jgi:hypothetical protein